MIKLTVLFARPGDPEAFERHYRERHLPLALALPSVVRYELALARPAADGSDPPFYRIADIWWEDEPAMQASMGSPEGQAMVADAREFADGLFTVMTAEVDHAS